MIAVAVIPARGGSKGIPRKNLQPLGGKPLLAHTAEAALTARSIQRCILSTDDPEIAEVGRRCGLDVPFLRPPELATDSARSVDVLLHVARWIGDEGESVPDAYVLLQPTAPLRTADDIDGAVATLAESDCDSVVSVCRVPSHFAPPWQLRFDTSGRLTLLDGTHLTRIITRRQELPDTYYRNGAVYVVRSTTLLGSGSLYGERTRGYVMPAERSVNIDTIEDLALAERYVSTH